MVYWPQIACQGINVPSGTLLKGREMHANKRAKKQRLILDTAYRLFREQGFDKTSMAEINARVGGSKSTIYSHFHSKEELFVECMTAALENYLSGTLQYLDKSQSALNAALVKFGTSVLTFICSPEQIDVRRLIIAEAARSGIGTLFFDKITALRKRVSVFLAAYMESGSLRRDDPDLAAEHFGALLEAEIIEPLLLQVRSGSPDTTEIAQAAQRAVTAFLRAYAPIDRQNSGKQTCQPA
jgi:AcrR family transcriptional regulator